HGPRQSRTDPSKRHAIGSGTHCSADGAGENGGGASAGNFAGRKSAADASGARASKTQSGTHRDSRADKRLDEQGIRRTRSTGATRTTDVFARSTGRYLDYREFQRNAASR